MVTFYKIVKAFQAFPHKNSCRVSYFFAYLKLKVVPNTIGWDRLMRRRLSQIEQLEDVSARYNGFMSVMSQSLVAPNFTENGWGLTRAPTELVDLLKQNLHEGLDKATEEYAIEVIRGASEDWQRPLFIKQRTLNKVILEELQPMHEDWAGIPLEGFQAYGLRIYRNESILHMHGKFFWHRLVSFCDYTKVAQFCLLVQPTE